MTSTPRDIQLDTVDQPQQPIHKRNYQQQLEQLIASLGDTNAAPPSLLLHSCCAPCSSYVLSYLRPFFAITVLYYNPNISPFAEYERRKQEQISLLHSLMRNDSDNSSNNNKHGSQSAISFLDCDYDGESFERIAQGLEDAPEKGMRCFKCYQLRLNKTAQIACQLGFDYFGTTLSVSPHKNADWLNQIGLELATRYQLNFLPADFKKKGGYQRSIALSRQHHLYRQNFCGCRFSRAARQTTTNSQPNSNSNSIT